MCNLSQLKQIELRTITVLYAGKILYIEHLCRPCNTFLQRLTTGLIKIIIVKLVLDNKDT